MQSRVIAIQLFEGLNLYADSTTVYKTLDLRIPALEGLMPHAESVWVEYLVENLQANEVDWNLEAFVGYNRNNEEPSPVDFFAADQAAVGSNRVAASNFTPADYYSHTRLRLRWRLNSAAGSAKQGRLSVRMFVQTKGA